MYTTRITVLALCILVYLSITQNVAADCGDYAQDDRFGVLIYAQDTGGDPGGTRWVGGGDTCGGTAINSSITITGSALAGGGWTCDYGTPRFQTAIACFGGTTVTLGSLPSQYTCTKTTWKTKKGDTITASGTGCTTSGGLHWDGAGDQGVVFVMGLADQPPKGYLDLVNSDCTAFGWTCDSDKYDASLRVDFYDENNSFVGNTTASNTREFDEATVAGLCGNTPNHGFAYTLPASYKNGETHTLNSLAIGVKSDGTLSGVNPHLTGSPKQFACLQTPTISHTCDSGSTNATVSWTQVPGATFYSPRLDRAYDSFTCENSSTNLCYDTASNTPSDRQFTFDTKGDPIKVWVHAANALSRWGPAAHYTFTCPIPGAPTGLTRTCSTSTSEATFSWNAVSGVTHYILRIDKNDGLTMPAEWDPMARPTTDQWVCIDVTSSIRPIIQGAAHNSWSVQSSNAGCSARYGTTSAGGFTCSIPPIDGRHDDATCTTSWGWACDPDDYSAPLDIDLYIDGDRSAGTHGGTFSAGALREPAVGSLCGGNPNHGFNIPIDDTFRDGVPHTLYTYAKNIGAGTDQLLPNSPRSITCIPDPWYKLSGASLYKNGAINNFIPANPLAFDGADTTERKLIIRGISPRLTQEGAVLPSSYVKLGTGAEVSTNQWRSTNYTRSTTYLSNLTSFIEYVKLRKKFKVITDLDQMESNTINLFIGNVPINDLGPINDTVDNAVLLVQGNITIDINNQFNPNYNSLALIATGNIDIHSQVKEIHGILIANSIDIAYDAPTTNELKVIGNLIATNDIDTSGLKRERSEWRQPSLFIQFDPNMYVDLLIPLSTIIQEGRTIE